VLANGPKPGGGSQVDGPVRSVRLWHRGRMAAAPAPVTVNATAAALLGLLRDGPATGGELVSSAESTYSGFFGLTRSQVYRELPVMAATGLLRLGRRGPRASQQYVLTAAGRKAFRGWLAAEPVGSADAVRSPLLLRLVHAGELTGPQRERLVDGARQVLAQRLVTARSAARAAEGPYAVAAAEFAVAHVKAVAKVVERVARV
jgi:DNA-binding PadR family transcriptional regulator